MYRERLTGAAANTTKERADMQAGVSVRLISARYRLDVTRYEIGFDDETQDSPKSVLLRRFGFSHEGAGELVHSNDRHGGTQSTLDYTHQMSKCRRDGNVCNSGAGESKL